MIVIKISDRIKPVPITYTAPPFQNPPLVCANKKLWEEIQRKDKIVRELAKEFKYKPGDQIYPKNEADQKSYGTCTVMSVVDQYIYLEKDFKWPANDNPMIVTAASETGEMFYATTNFFK